METFKIGDITFYSFKWDIEKQLDNQKYVLPLINSPLVTSMSVGDDPDMMLPALVSGLLDSLASVDIKFLMSLFMKDVTFEPKGSVPKEASFKTLTEAGFDLADLHTMLVKLVLIQYGAFLKKGLQGTLSEILSSLMPESKPSLEE